MVPDSLRRRIADTAKTNCSARQDHQNHSLRSSPPLAIRLEKRISDIQRIVGFLTDMMFGLISAFFAIVAVAFADSDASWQDTTCAGVLAFLISMWIANFLFPNATRWCLK